MRLLLLTSLMLTLLNVAHAQGPDLTLHAELEHIIPDDLPNSTEFTGLFKDGIAFQDNAGENFIVFSEVWNRAHTRNTIYLRQLTRLKGTIREKWSFSIEGNKNCPVQFIENSLRIIDLDGDGAMEVSFGLRKDCPDSIGLHEWTLFSNGRKHTARAFHDPIPEVARDLITFDKNLRDGSQAFQWFLKEEWKAFVTDMKIRGLWSWEIQTGDINVIRWEAVGKSPKKRFTWLGKDGTPAYLPDEMRPMVRTARSFHLLESSGEILVLHSDAIGTINPRTKKFEAWRSFQDGDLLLSDWTWSPSKQRFAFAVLNRRKYKDQTAIVTMDLKEGKMADTYDHQVPVAYQITDVARGFPLIFHDERHVEFTAHPPETPPNKREQWLLDTLPEE